MSWPGFIRQSELPHARLVPAGSALAFESSYDRGLVADLKAQIPADGRKWDPQRKVWMVAPQYAGVCVALAATYLGVSIQAPKVSATTAIETRLILLEYLGRAKDRGNGQSSAFGWVDGGWSAIFPEDVLRAWFDTPKVPTQERTLYNVLAVKQHSTPDELKSAYRRLVMQWHPDRCHEPDAAEQFMRIQAAYEVLGEPLKRKKYDAGLYLQSQAKKVELDSPRGEVFTTYGGESQYCAPYRTGYLLCEGIEQLGRFVVSKVLQWEDVANSLGQTMVASWPMGADRPEVAWR